MLMLSVFWRSKTAFNTLVISDADAEPKALESSSVSRQMREDNATQAAVLPFSHTSIT